MKRAIIFLAVVAVIAVSVTAHAQRMGRGMGPGMMHGYGQGYGDEYGQSGDYGYGLSQEDAQAYRQIYDKYAKEMYELRSELYGKMEQLNAMIWRDKIDDGKVDSLVSAINKLRADLFSKSVDMKLELADKGLPRSLSCPGGPAGCPGYGMGPGMMGPGMGYGMGPGMMGPGMGYGMGYGMGPGMMGPGMMGPGMMGPGMMRGWGQGPGYWGYGQPSY